MPLVPVDRHTSVRSLTAAAIDSSFTRSHAKLHPTAQLSSVASPQTIPLVISDLVAVVVSAKLHTITN